jgi:hypothetical protein
MNATMDDREPETNIASAEAKTAGLLGPNEDRSWAVRQLWPVMLTVVFVSAGMAYMLCWNSVVHHSDSWVTGGDLWGIYRGAHYIGWGYLGGIYTNGTGIVAFPGMSVLLAPVAWLTGELHMTESYAPYFLARPGAALVLQPIELLVGASIIFAANALAERLDVARSRRASLCVMTAIVAWPVAALWGHAEDVVAVTLALYAMVAMLNRKWARMGWLLGVGILMQPLVALLVPLFIAVSPRGQRLLLAIRSAALSAILVTVAAAGDAADTYRQLVQQPTPPSINHATPWAALAPKLTSSAVRTIHGAELLPGLGHPAAKSVTTTATQLVLVSGGAGRMIDVVLAFLLGVFVWRHPQPPIRILWLAAAVLASRCFFEPVMTPYYLTPPLFLGLIMASRQSTKRFWSSALLALEVTVFAYHHLNPWAWWLPVVASLAAIVALAYPSDLKDEREPTDEDDCVRIESEGNRDLSTGAVELPALRPSLVSN